MPIDSRALAHNNSRLNRWIWCAVIAGLYYVLGKAGLQFAQLHPSATLVWPPTGLALAAMILLGYRIWPGIFVGAFLVNATTAGNILTSLGIASGNTVEALLGGYLVHQFAHGERVFERLIDVIKYALLVGAGSTAVSALIGVTSLTLGGFSPLYEFPSTFLTWWLGDMTGALVITPLIVTFFTIRHTYTRQQTLEFIALNLLICLFGLITFTDWFFPPSFRAPVPYLVMPVLFWIANRYTQKEAAFAAFITGIFAISGTWHGFGPFIRASANESLIFLQIFVGTLSLLGVAFAALVAEEKKAQKALREKDSEFVDLVENASFGIHWVDWDGKILWANKAEMELLGYSPKEYINHPVDEFHLDPSFIKDKLSQMRGGVKSIPNYEATLRSKDGSLKHVQLNSMVIEENGHFLHVRCITQDITHRKESERVLKQLNQDLEEKISERTHQLESANRALQIENQERKRAEAEIITRERQLAEAQRLAKIGSWEWDIPSNKMTWSKELHRIFEFPAEKFDGTFETTVRRFHKDDQELVRRHFENAYRNHTPFQFEARIICPENRQKIIEIQGKMLAAERGRVTQMSGIFQDTTERSHLLESKLLLAEIVESSEDGIVSTTLDGVITSWNRGAEQLYGWTKEEAIGRHISFIFPAKQYNEFFEISMKVKRNEQVQSYETLRVRKDGKRIDVSVVVSPIKDSLGKTTGIAKVFRDITVRKQLEKAILEATDAERQRIGQDLHDGLGQQLLGIAFLANVLKKNLNAKSSDIDAKDATLIEEHINKALAHTRALSSQMYLAELEKSDLATALKQLVSQVNTIFPIQCSFQCDTQVSIEDPSVRSALYRIGQEALSNAVKHSQGKNITLSLNQEKELVTLTVKDDGVGIPQGSKDAGGIGIRNMFFRANTIGANLEVQSDPHGGTLVMCTKTLNNQN